MTMNCYTLQYQLRCLCEPRQATPRTPESTRVKPLPTKPGRRTSAPPPLHQYMDSGLQKGRSDLYNIYAVSLLCIPFISKFPI